MVPVRFFAQLLAFVLAAAITSAVWYVRRLRARRRIEELDRGER
jgi:hypothetical protein